MTHLPDVTLVCVDTRTPERALQAIAHCTAGLRFAEVLLFTEGARRANPPPGVTLLELALDSVTAYSQFMLRGLLPHIRTSHCLIVQWDGYVLDARQWDADWLQHDYIGALFRGVTGPRAVGNGGFSLRSRRLLLALQDPAMAIHHPEDVCICHTNRDRLERAHAIRFAPPEVAAHFAFERVEPTGPTFGFHGLFNFHRVMAPAALCGWLADLPDAMAAGLDGHDLCRALIDADELDAAHLLLAKRWRHGHRDRRTWRLRLLLAWARWRRHPSARLPP